MMTQDPTWMRAIIRDGLPGRAARPARVLVLGAGMAGLVTATELLRAGHEVEVVEARMRVGGRVETLRAPFSAGLYGEAGAMRIPTQHHLVLDYVARAGLKTQPFVMQNPAAWSVLLGQRRRLGEALHAQEQPIGPLWEQTLQRYRALLTQGGRAAWPQIAAALQPLSLRDWLLQEGWTSEQIELFGMLAGFETLLYGAALEFVREALLGLKDETVFIEGGMDQLPASFLPALQGRIRYGTAVSALGQDSQGVTVQVQRLGGRDTLRADYAVVTLPFSVLRHVEWLQPPSLPKQRALRNLHYEAAVKIFFEARRRFWEEDDGIHGGASITDLAIRSTYYPQHGVETRRGVFIGSYCHGQDALRWGSLEPTERLRQALDNIEEIHPGARQEIEGGASKVWMNDPFAGGAYAFFQAHQEAALHDSIVAPEGRYHFAGEHCSLTHRWIQGAVESGLRVAAEIHQRACAS